jgi:23S rRNA (pseudouridine1915-N3)-methyltransferase
VRVLIVAVGKLKDRGLRAAVDDYVTRIGRYGRCEEVELKDGPVDELAGRLERYMTDRSMVVALEVEGRALSSEGLAGVIDRAEQSGTQTLVFFIGGSYGLPKRVSERADVQLSLSAMTFPHRLVRLMLVEQVYRAFTILRGEPYSH